MEYHVVVIAIDAELEEGAGGGGAFFAKEININGSVRCVEDYTACVGGLGAVDLAHCCVDVCGVGDVRGKTLLSREEQGNKRERRERKGGGESCFSVTGKYIVQTTKYL